MVLKNNVGVNFGVDLEKGEELVLEEDYIYYSRDSVEIKLKEVPESISTPDELMDFLRGLYSGLKAYVDGCQIDKIVFFQDEQKYPAVYVRGVKIEIDDGMFARHSSWSRKGPGVLEFTFVGVLTPERLCRELRNNMWRIENEREIMDTNLDFEEDFDDFDDEDDWDDDLDF